MAHADFVLDASEQALHEQKPAHQGGSSITAIGAANMSLSIKYSERFSESGIEPSIGSLGDSYNNALAESINGLYVAQVIHTRGPWRSFEALEFATLKWVNWFNNKRILEPIGNIPLAEAEKKLLHHAGRKLHGSIT